MDSIFRLLLHEESLSKGYNLEAEARLQQSVEYHRRDLATILETAKWQVGFKKIRIIPAPFCLFPLILTLLIVLISWKTLKER